MKKIAEQEVEITTKDPYYWIAHYVFDDKCGIDSTVIKKKIHSLADECNLQNESSDTSNSSSQEE